MTDNYILMGAARQAEIEAAKSIFFSKGKRIQILPAAGDGFPPDRTDKIDPDTVLKRRRAKPSMSDRKRIRQMADSL
ncbi:hypothetical protein [Pseudomonas alabamensis]|uniref:hypothetical protein n=1 Tax=Pseudomonas alabamensis TaxID=3064349 RepID=UPI003F652A80